MFCVIPLAARKKISIECTPPTHTHTRERERERKKERRESKCVTTKNQQIQGNIRQRKTNTIFFLLYVQTKNKNK